MPHLPSELPSVNWLAVITAAIATFMLGGLWYTALFGKLWQRLNGYSDEKLADMRRRRPPPVFFSILLACYFIIALVMALVCGAHDIHHWQSGAGLGLVAWIVILAVQATGHVASDKPWSALFIDAAYQLIYLPMTGAIIASWR